VVAAGVEARTDNRALIQLQRTSTPQRGLERFFAGRFGLRSRQRVNLDAHGTFFWQQIDGRRDLAEIARRVREQHGLDEKEGRDAVVSFTAMLMRRRLINLRIDD